MSIQTIAGAFTQVPISYTLGFGGTAVCQDPGGGGAFSAYTSGITRVSPLTVQPSLVQDWSVLGITVQTRAAVVAINRPTVAFTFGRFGSIWAGLFLDTPVRDFGPPQFPADMSPFTKIWDRDSDPPLRLLQNVTADPGEDLFSLLATTFMFPVPLSVRSGSQLAMGLILTPSLVDGGVLVNTTPQNIGLNTVVTVKSCRYSVLYDDH